jgi:hypothetical protein
LQYYVLTHIYHTVLIDSKEMNTMPSDYLRQDQECYLQIYHQKSNRSDLNTVKRE